jgi:hypothetical protein
VPDTSKIEAMMGWKPALSLDGTLDEVLEEFRQIEGRYPSLLPPAPDIETARQELEQAREVFEWLSHQLLR